MLATDSTEYIMYKKDIELCLLMTYFINLTPQRGNKRKVDISNPAIDTGCVDTFGEIHKKDGLELQNMKRE